MQSQNRLLDDLARVASGAVGALVGVRDEMEELFRQRLERYLAEAEMVPRDEFETLKAVAVQAREAQEVLEARVAALEAEIAALTKPARRAPLKNCLLYTSDAADEP